MAHESEVPNAGDFKTAEIAGQPIIVVRHTDGTVRILFNRCMHRGATVCEVPSGNTTHFRCPHHAWAYQTNGDLALVPNRELFGPDFDLTQHGLVSVPRVESYGRSFSPA